MTVTWTKDIAIAKLIMLLRLWLQYAARQGGMTREELENATQLGIANAKKTLEASKDDEALGMAEALAWRELCERIDYDIVVGPGLLASRWLWACVLICIWFWTEIICLVRVLWKLL